MTMYRTAATGMHAYSLFNMVERETVHRLYSQTNSIANVQTLTTTHV